MINKIKEKDQEGPSLPVILALLPVSDDTVGSTQLGREDWSIIVLSPACQPILDLYILCCAEAGTELTYYSLIHLGFGKTTLFTRTFRKFCFIKFIDFGLRYRYWQVFPAAFPFSVLFSIKTHIKGDSQKLPLSHVKVINICWNISFMEKMPVV